MTPRSARAGRAISRWGGTTLTIPARRSSPSAPASASRRTHDPEDTLVRRARPDARRLPQLARGGASELLHAGRFSRYGGRPEDRPRRDRRLVHGRPESGVLPPWLADAHRGAVGPDRRPKRERFTLRPGQLYPERVERMAVARLEADLRRHKPGERAHRAHPPDDPGVAGRGGPLSGRRQI